MKHLKMFVCLLICVCLMVPVLSACNNDSEVSKAEEVSKEENSEAGEAGFAYANEYYDTTVKIFCVDTSRHIYGELQFKPTEEDTGSQVSTAVENRNNLIKQNHGITIETYAVNFPTEEIKLLIEGGKCDYDIVVDSVDRMTTKIADKIFWSVDDIVDLKDPWWDYDSIDSLTLTDSHYLLCGDAIITDDDHTYLTLFNKSLYEDNGDITAQFGDIYDLVDDKKFTIDAYTKMAKLASQPDADGQWSYNATYGNLSHAYGATIMLNGAGLALASRNSENGMTVNVNTDLFQSVSEQVYNLMADPQCTIRAEQLIKKLPNVQSNYGFAELEYLFTNGQGLFYNTTASSISALKKATAQRKFEFGVLPIPLYDGQDTYHCAVNRYQSSVIGIPVSNKNNLKATALLLNCLGYYSGDVTTAYYELTLQLQALDDQRDADMLDIAFKSRFYDIGAILPTGGLEGLMSRLIGDTTGFNLGSAWAAIEDSVESAIEQTVIDFSTNLT